MGFGADVVGTQHATHHRTSYHRVTSSPFFLACQVYDYNATKEELALAEVKPDLIIDCVRGPEVG